MLGFTCGVADLVCAVYFPGRDVRNNPYLIFGSVEMLFGTYCFGSESFNWRSWLGAAALIYCGAERYCMAPLLADRRYVTPFPPVRRYDVPF